MSESVNELTKMISDMKKFMMIIMAAALVALPAMAQQFRTSDQPQTEFQSTSTMQTSGSVYASQPALNADGTAYNPGAAIVPEQNPSGPRKIDVYTPETDPNAPIGDAVMPLTLMALAFAGVMYLRRRRATR